MKTIDLVVLDLDGTLYSAGVAIPGAAEAVATIRGRGIAVRFATNTFTKSAFAIEERLAGFGIPVRDGELVTPRDVLRERYASRPDARVLVFSDPDLVAAMDWLPPGARAFDPDIPETGRWDEILVVDSGKLWSYNAFDRLLSLLHDGAVLVASSAAASFIGKDGRPHPDTGAATALLEAAAGVRAAVAGKPGIDMARYAILRDGFDPARTVVAGDDPEVDVALARSIGAIAVLVETGRRKIPPVLPEPDATIASVADLPGLLVSISRRC
ncbi:MAG: HAD hydrolase-like protein [Spirochaetes bacterium]|nr:HAD hydrolase-like protein [Spirochaetota bacterium]